MQSTNWLTPGKKLIWMNRIVLSLWSRRIFDPWRFGWFSIETIWKKIIIFHVPDSVLVRYSNSSTVPLCETHIFSRLKRNEKRRNRLVRLFCFVSEIHFFDKLICGIFCSSLCFLPSTWMWAAVVLRSFLSIARCLIELHSQKVAKIMLRNEKLVQEEGKTTSRNRSADFLLERTLH